MKNMRSKTLFCLIVATLFVMSTSAVKNGNEKVGKFASILDDGFLDQKQVEHDGGFACIGEDAFAQEFVPSMNHLTRIELLILRNETVLPGPEVIIRDSLNGGDLRSVELNDNFSPNEYLWVEINFDDLEVNPGETYYIIFGGFHGGHKTQTYYWGYGNSTPIDLYPMGESYFYDESDDEWLRMDYILGYDVDFCFRTYGYNNTPPDKPEQPSGETILNLGVWYTFSTSTTDFDGDKIKYGWDWNGDKEVDEWTKNYNSGVKVEREHSWTEGGTFPIRVKARECDSPYGESPWSDPLIVYVGDEKAPQLSITKPVDGYLYFNDRQIMPIPANVAFIIGPITFKVDAIDECSGMDKIEFYINTELKHTDNEIPYEWLWNNSAFGRFNVKVKAFDRAGNMAMTEQRVWIFNL